VGVDESYHLQKRVTTLTPCPQQATMPAVTTLAKYLFTRLRQSGVHAAHGVPGDFTLKALDDLKGSGLKWIGNCNELNAGYAADGYARVRGLGAIYTTYGVGELSAINAIAGSMAEHVPVVHIVGTPPSNVQRSGAKIHHSLGDGRLRVYADVYKKFTVAQANLIDSEKAPEAIDSTLGACLRESKPVYIELPHDMVTKEVSAERLQMGILEEDVGTDGRREADQVQSLLYRLYAAKRPLLLVDRADGVQHSIKHEINEFIERTGIPALTMPSGAGMVDNSIPNYFGVHSGPVGQVDTSLYLDSCDLVLAFGPMFSDTQTLGWKTVPDAVKTVTIGKGFVLDGRSGAKTDINAKVFMRALITRVNHRRLAPADTTALGDFRLPSLPGVDLDSAIDQNGFYRRINPYLRPDDIVLLGCGTPMLGGRDLVLPSGAQVIVSGMQFSVGHTLPAALGAALAQQERNASKRTIVIDGDGDFQMSVQEISTIIRQRLNVTIFLVNNAGYACERQRNGMDADYNEIAQWRYIDIPRVLGADLKRPDYPVISFRVQTWRDLEAFLDKEGSRGAKGFRLVEVAFDRHDVPEKFKLVLKAAVQKLAEGGMERGT
jgi:pyruvate decarboxylase